MTEDVIVQDTAKYGTYTLFNMDKKAILDFQLVQVSEVENSSRMEKVGLERSLTKLEESGLEIEVLATDQHPQVAAFMKKSTCMLTINLMFGT